MLTPHTQATHNIQRTWLLMGVFFTIIVLLGWVLSYIYNDVSLLYMAVGFSFFSNIFAYFQSDKIALATSGAKPADPKNSQHQMAIRLVENLSISQGMKTPRVYIIEDPAMNAFATGRDEKNAVIAFTTGILGALEKSELEGVAAHELAHIKNRDILVMTIVVTLVGAVSLIADMFLRSTMMGGTSREGKDGRGQMILMIVGIVFVILTPIIAKLIQLAISRKREYLADASGVQMTRYPEGLASALEKISTQSRPVMRAHTATAHLYISSPFANKGEQAKNFLTNLFSTHPPIEDRVESLRGMNQ